MRGFLLLLFVGFACLSPAAVPRKSKITSIRQVDFENFVYAWSDPPSNVPLTWHWLAVIPDAHFRAVNGIHHFYAPGQNDDERLFSPLISVDSVIYGDLDGDGAEEAIVALNYSTGGTANWDYLYIYKLEKGQVRLVARMQTGSRGDGGLVKMFVRDQVLVVDFADPERRMGDCCSDGYIRVRYVWQDANFVEEGAPQYGDLELREGPPRPRFRDYPVKKIFHGKPAPPIIVKQFRGFRTSIRRGASNDVEFAGHYTIPRWGCGAECNTFVIVDSISGKVYDGFGIVELPSAWEDEHKDDGVNRMEFRPNSSLLKINACPNENNCGLYDYEMIEGKGLKLIRKELLPTEFQPSPLPQ